MSISWQAREAGFPSGYSLADGKWMYQTAARGSAPEKEMYDLVTTEQYRTMRDKMDKDDSVGVLVWHVSLNHLFDYLLGSSGTHTKQKDVVWTASQESKARAAEEITVRCDNPEDEPMNEDGTPMFNPTFDPWKELPEIMQNEMTETSAPSAEPLSDEENDRVLKRKRAAKR